MEQTKATSKLGVSDVMTGIDGVDLASSVACGGRVELMIVVSEDVKKLKAGDILVSC